jgi:lipopolysaccharide export system protein LptA
MDVKKIVKILLFFIFLTSLMYIFYDKYYKIDKSNTVSPPIDTIDNSGDTNLTYNSNIIEDVNYKSTDAQGNQYIISAKRGEIDYSEPNILFLTDVTALIKLKNSDNIEITSDFGKYNSNNFDTIFSKNVLIRYLDNKIKANYLDFSLEKNLMIMSGKVIYNNLENILEADAVEINIKTKDTKIFMYENEKKVNIRSIN